MAESIQSYVPLYAILVSHAAVLLILLSARIPNLREFWTLAAAVGKFLLVFSLLPAIRQGMTVRCDLLEISPSIVLSLKVDELGLFFALVSSGLWILTSLYSIGYVRGLNERRQTRYFASFALCLSATVGIAFSANLLTFIIFYEVLTVATYPLVIHKETPEAIRAGRKYLLFTLSAGVLLIGAAAWVYQLAGTLEFEPGGMLARVAASPNVFLLLFVIFLAGVGVKAGIMPLHSWLPTAMVAPTPVSALLHAVAVVKAGVFGVLRVVGFVFGPDVMRAHGLDTLLATLAMITILVASLLALREDNLKRRLAYSTVGHLSYIILGAAFLNPYGFTGGVLHIATHATMKITLFFAAGAIYVVTHRELVSELDGIGKAMPWTMGAFAVGSLGLIGVPPVNGFISKWLLGVGSLESGGGVPLLVLLASGLLNASYFLPILQRAFFRTSDEFRGYQEASSLLVVPIVITGLLSLVLGIWPDAGFHFYDLAVRVALSLAGGEG